MTDNLASQTLATQNIATLSQAATRAVAAGDFATARAMLMQVVERDKVNLAAWLNLSGVCRQLNDFDAAFNALREALKLDSRNFPALLMVASLLEREGRIKPAAAAYGIALFNAPPDQKLDGPTLQAVNHARGVHGKHIKELNDYIREAVANTDKQCAPQARRRIDAFIGTTLRTRKRYHQDPSDYLYPGLPSIEFYDRHEFPWLPELEAATTDIQTELARIMREDQREFAPYVQYEDHLPLDQWRELNHSPRWSAFHFYDRGKPVEARCQRAPLTMQALGKLPQPHVPLRSPAALFSVLQPHTRIPPHTGVANFRLLIHLPLILPPQCGFRCGGETREWRLGKAWVFDDTIEHEAWNESDQTRVILICDIWSPRLSEEERIVIGQIIAATDAFNGVDPANSV
jgi:hypothetical protein